MSTITCTPDVRDRIYASADALYEQSGKTTYPTVDAVRKDAKVNMNDASSVMRQWRRERKGEVTPVTVPLPDAVQAVLASAATSIWTKAQDVANEALQAAQSGWEVERAELEAMRKELAEAFETQATELQEAQRLLLAKEQELTQAREETIAAAQASQAAQAMLGEVRKRNEELMATLAQAQEKAERSIADAARLQGMLDALRPGAAQG